MTRYTLTGFIAFLGALSLPILFQNCGDGGFQRAVQVQGFDADGNPINVGPSPLEGQYFVFSSQAHMCLDGSCSSEAIFFLADQRMVFDGEGGYELKGACGDSTGAYSWSPQEGRTHALSFQVPNEADPTCADADEELMLKGLLSLVEGLQQDLNEDYVEFVTGTQSLGNGEISQTRLFLIKEDVAFPELTNDILRREYWFSEVRRFNCSGGDVSQCSLSARQITSSPSKTLEFASGDALNFGDCNTLFGSYDLGDQDLTHRKPINLNLNTNNSNPCGGAQSQADQAELFQMIPEVRSVRLRMMAGQPNLHFITHSGEVLVFRPMN